MSNLPDLKFEKSLLANTQLPSNSYQFRGATSTMFQPLSSWGESDGFLNFQLNWISLFLWQSFNKVNEKDCEIKNQIQGLKIEDPNINEKLEKIKVALSAIKFKDVIEMIENIKEIDEDILRKLREKTDEIINQNKLEYIEERLDIISKLLENLSLRNLERIEEKIKSMEQKIDKMYKKLFLPEDKI